MFRKLFNRKANEKKLIMHVGSGKCASSSLQQSLAALNKGYPRLQDYQHLSKYKLLKYGDLDENIKRKYIESIVNERSSDTLIVSNEGLLSGSFPSIKPFCEAALNKNGFDLVIISMLTRSPSSHAISSFHQWHFRNRQMLKEDISLSEKIGINWKTLSPLERRLLAMCLQSEFRDWGDIVQKLKRETKEFGESVRIVSRHMPAKNNNYPLLQQFLEDATLSKNYKNHSVKKFETRSNDRFSEALTYAISSLISLENHTNPFVPKHYEMIPFVKALSLLNYDNDRKFADTMPVIYPGLERNLYILANCIDWHARHSVTSYCKEFNQNMDLFFNSSQPDLSVPLLDVIEEVKKISQTRKIDEISTFNQSCIENLGLDFRRLSNEIPWIRIAEQLKNNSFANLK